MAIEKGRAASALTPVAPCGTHPPSLQTQVQRPVGTAIPTGQLLLEVQQMNHNSRYDVSKRKRRDVPEELLHGVSPLPGDVPHAPVSNGSSPSCLLHRIHHIIRPDGDGRINDQRFENGPRPRRPERGQEQIDGAVHGVLQRLVVYPVRKMRPYPA